MSILGIGKLFGAAYKYRTRFLPKALILVYHQVAELVSDPWALSVTPRHFAEHVEVLRRHFRPLALRQLVEALSKGDLLTHTRRLHWFKRLDSPALARTALALCREQSIRSSSPAFKSPISMAALS